MNEYEILIETINPCGGEARANREIVEDEAERPEAYVKTKAPYPVIHRLKTPDGDTLIITGDGSGGIVRYTFTEL